MDLRDRLARVAAARAVLREAEAHAQDHDAAAGDVASGRGVALGAPPSTSPAAAYSVHEERFDVPALGLEIVGIADPDPLTLAHLGLRGEPPRRWEDIVFLDTETTGLSSGTGTYVFLLGTARIVDGELVLRQHLLQHLGGERAFVEAIHRELGAFRACASYNGKAFDLPILRTRIVLALRGELAVDESHLDLLHPARRLWRDRFGSTTLRQLEASVLDEPRGNDDIAGSLIPDRYFHYLRTRDERIIEPVMRHNARDVISLVRITDRVARAVMDARRGRVPDHAPAALALARIFERHGEGDPAYWCYESAYVEGDPTIRVRASLPYARALEARGDVDRAIAMLETLLALGRGPPSWREQAESRLRRLMKVRWRRRELAPAS